MWNMVEYGVLLLKPFSFLFFFAFWRENDITFITGLFSGVFEDIACLNKIPL